jgi:tape measure domain-containing protein
MAKIDIGIIINAVNRATPALRGARRDVDDLGRSAQRATGHFRAFHLVLGLVTGGILINMSKRIVNVIGNMQNLQIRVANITGGLEQGNAALARMSKTFEAMPFDIETIANGFVRMQAAGVSLEKTEQFTKALVNSVAAFGGTTQELERGFLGFSQAASKGILSMEELRQQILEAVPVANRLFASQTLDKSIAKFTDKVAKGLVTAEEAIDLFIKAANDAFGNYGELLAFTISGSLGRIVNIFKIQIARIVSETTLDERLSVIFFNIGTAIRDFMESIDEAKIATFFEWLRRVAVQAEKIAMVFIGVGGVIIRVIGNIVKALDFVPGEALEVGVLGMLLFGRVPGAIGKIGRAIVGVETLFVGLLSSMGADLTRFMKAVEFGFSFGIIGFMFFGPIGAAIGSAVGLAVGAIYDDIANKNKAFFERVDAQTDRFGSDILSKMSRKRGIGSLLNNSKEEAADSGKEAGTSFIENMFGTADQIKLFEEQMKALGSSVKLPEVDTTPFDKSADKILKQSDNLRERVADAIRNVSDALDTLERDIVGDELGEAIARINDRWGDQSDKLEDALTKAIKLNTVTGQEGDEIQRINELLLRADILREKAIGKEQRLYDLKIKQNLLQDQINRNTLKGQIDDLQNQLDPTLRMLSQTAGGQVFLDVQRQRIDLSNQVLETESQIAELNNRLLYEQNPAMQQSLQASIALYQQLHDQSIMALDQLSAAGVATDQFWTGVGNAIFDNVGSAIQGMIEGTFTWRDAMSRVFSELTELALEYLGKLIMIKAIEAATGAAGGGNTAAALGTLGEPGSAPGFGFANGAAFNGMVKPFAKGDIIGGPTLFGVAGEKGEEAIMPLERIGGKLGVNATGMGDSYHISIHAIDTQSGVEFLMKNMDSIVGGIRHRGRLNHGLGRTL